MAQLTARPAAVVRARFFRGPADPSRLADGVADLLYANDAFIVADWPAVDGRTIL